MYHILKVNYYIEQEMWRTAQKKIFWQSQSGVYLLRQAEYLCHEFGTFHRKQETIVH